MTHTYALLEVPPEMFEFVKKQLTEAGYEHAFDTSDGKPVIDMHGIALAPMTDDKTVETCRANYENAGRFMGAPEILA
jgi:hypothetical protein